MQIVVRRIVGISVIVLIAWQIWEHRQIVALPRVAVPGKEASDQHSDNSQQQEANPIVTVAGRFSELFKSKDVGNDQNKQPALHEMVASDHVGTSPVGTATVLLHKTFHVTQVVAHPFQLPPHAFNPQLRGTYLAYPQGTDDVADEPGSVQFLLLSEEQYANLVSGHPAEALLTADGSQEQEINFRMPPTFEQPARYYLVFRNTSDHANQTVRAEFQIEF